MKKISAMLLAVILLMSAIVYTAAEETEEAAVMPEYDLEQLDVAVITPMTGKFFTSLWGNNTSDTDVRALIHGYALTIWDVQQGMFRPDETVVNAIVGVEDGANGDHTYTIVLNDDLYYCDGSKVTAWDYAFSILFSIAPELDALGASPYRPTWLVGYDDYIRGVSPVLTGVRVLTDDQLSISISGEYLPFFFELGLMNIYPYPVSAVAPGVAVADDGNGVYLTNADGGAEPAFTAEALRESIFNEETGYMSHPSVTCGPYVLKSYENGEAAFELNSYYKNDPMGNKPTIQRINFKSLGKDELVDALADGSVGLLNKVSGAEEIVKGMELVSENELYAMTTYPRTGLAFLNLSAGSAAATDENVRKALMYALDRDALIEASVGSYGVRADGYYGLGQWMAQMLNGTLPYPIEEAEEGNAASQKEYEEQVEKWEELTLDEVEIYEYDPAAANELLNAAGWNLNAEGGAYDMEKDAQRYRRGANGLEPFELKVAYGKGSAAGAAITELLPEQLSGVGIAVTVDEIATSELLAEYYGQTEAKYDMLFLATNFDVLYDPTSQFMRNANYRHVWRSSGIDEEELYNLAIDMNQTEPGDFYGYCEKWVAFQELFMEKLPVLPIYSNVYFDFYAQVLYDYDILANASWAEALNAAYLDEYVAQEELEGEEGEDGEIVIP